MTLTWYRHFERNGGLNQILIIVTNKQTNKNNNKNNNYKQKHLPNIRTADSRFLGIHKVYMQRFLNMLRLLRVLIKGTGSSFTGYNQENLTYFLHL